VYGARRDPAEVVRAFGRRAGGQLPDDELLVQLSEALVRVFRAASAEVWRDAGTGVLEQVVSVPHHDRPAVELDPAARRILAGGGVVGRAWLEMWQPQLLEDRPVGEVRVAPATHGGELLGLVVVTRLAGGDRFTSEEDASLAELGGRLGVVLHNRELNAALRDTFEDLRRTNAELRASRVRLVSTADAERRRIERDLHDGAQQHLVALAVNLRLAADEVAANPESVPDVFDALGRDVREAINEVRSLAHGIYPPLLLDAGLVEALTVSARRSASPVTLTADRVGRYDTDVEAAVYFCCMEALQNAAKHAPGAAVHVHLEEVDATLRLIVDDAGPGLGDGGAARRGHGLDNMADRLGAVGGELELTASPTGGTRVCGAVPVAPR
jgi:signal transduction histidine kinase